LKTVVGISSKAFSDRLAQSILFDITCEILLEITVTYEGVLIMKFISKRT